MVNNANKPFNYKQIAAQIEGVDQKEVSIVLNLLVRDSKIEMADRSRYFYRQSSNEFTGVLDFNQRGVAFLVSDKLDQDIKIAQGDTLDAFLGDEVRVKVVFTRKHHKPRAMVTAVIKRARTEFVGTLSSVGNLHFVIPTNQKIHTDFFIPPEKIKGAKDGDKVLVKFRDWPSTAKNPYGEIIEVFGAGGSNHAEMHAIVAEFGFRTEFSEAVEREAANLPSKISLDEIKKREDFRKITTFTIDPVDAKDFDDAISVQFLENGLIEVGVHIADVSYYVPVGSLIDKEAIDRATSVYLVDRTIPMLPERLSNELCSLRPHEESLCFSVIFTMNEHGKVLKHRFVKTVIYSDHRFAYEDAQRIIEGEGHPLSKEILALNELAHHLRKRRFENGSINFETTEFKFELDDEGRPLAVNPKVRFDAHKLIEEFMLLANQFVARYMYVQKQKAPIPYRVHEEPSVDKLKEFASTAAEFGYKIDLSSYSRLAKSINEMVNKVEGTLEGDILQPLAIRSMEKAYYTSKKSGHFGLAFEHYAHFTSPIRRYPDLITHRMLFSALHNKTPEQLNEAESLAKHCSEQEQKAVNAERASVKYKQVEYLSQFRGESFEGIISGVTEWGIYVEIIENKCEGMVRIKDMKGDNFLFYPEKKKVIGSRTRRTYSMGDHVTIRIKSTNLQNRTIDFEMIYE